MFYDRKIKYVEVMDKGERLQTAGFVKLEAKGERVCIQISLSGLRRTDTGECSILLFSAEKKVELGKITLDGGKGQCTFEGLEINNLVEGISYEELEGMQIKLPRGVVLRCIIQQRKAEAAEVTDLGAGEPETAEVAEPRRAESEVVEAVESRAVEAKATEAMEPEATKTAESDGAEAVERKPAEQEMALREESVSELSEPELMRVAFMEEKRLRGRLAQESRAEEHKSLKEKTHVGIARQVTAPEKTLVFSPASDKWQQLWEIYPHITPFEDHREYLSIKLQDFVILSKKFFELSFNSFLLHGYYNYEHLILCRAKRENKECYYIGVPGNFYDKEKQVAVLFGFESFEGKREPAGCGDFGYYMVPVEI